jgi:hypothetical protein
MVRATAFQELSMTALTHPNAGVLVRARKVRGLVGAIAFLRLVVDAMAEGQEMARAAHRRYPFIDWS